MASSLPPPPEVACSPPPAATSAPSPSRPKPGCRFEPNCWEVFLSGQKCPCVACWTFFGLGILFTALLLYKIWQDGSDIFTFEEQPVKTNLVVQARYAFEAARGEASGCGDSAHEEEDACVEDPACTWDTRTTKCNPVERCPEPSPRPREINLMSGDGMPAWIFILYEAPKGGNIFDDEVLGYMAKFEEKLLTTANGAKSNGKPSPWNEDWCVKAYATTGGDAEGKCASVASVAGLFTMTEEARNVIKEQVEAGYTSSGTLGKCMCSHEDGICQICTLDGMVKNLTDWPPSLLACLVAPNANGEAGGAGGAGAGNSSTGNFSTGSPGTGNPSASDNLCGGGPTGGAAAMTPAGLMGTVAGVCRSKQSCQYAPPQTSMLCSSTAFYATDWKGLVTGDEKEAVLKKVCNEDDPGWWNQRKNLLPNSLDCENKQASFARTVFFPGAEDPKDEKAYDKFEKEYISGRGGWYMQVRLLEAEIERESKGKLRIMLYSAVTILSQMLEILLVDGLLSILSMIMVWAYMWWTLESFFLACCAMFEIVFSLPVTMCLWTLVLQQKIIYTQMLVIYMILGIGADDAFILYDAWLQSRFADEEIARDPMKRFAYAYRKSFHAMAITTATTCGSFVIGAASPLPAVRDFCVFAAIVVLVDWVFCETFFASAMMVWEKYFRSSTARPGECCGPGCCCGLCKCMAVNMCGNRCVDTTVSDEPKKRTLEKFCEGPLFRFLNKFKLLLIVFWTLAIIGMGSWASVELRTAKKRSPIGREDIDTIRGFDVLLEEFSFRGAPAVNFFWGLDEEKPMKKWDDGNDHEPAYGDIGPLVTPAGQVELLSLCRAADLGRMDNTRCDTRDCLVLGRGGEGACAPNQRIWREQGVWMPDDELCQTGRYCFMEEFAEFWAYTKDGCSSKNETQCPDANGCAWAPATANSLPICYSTTDPMDYTGLEADEFEALLNGPFLLYQEQRNNVLQAVGRGYQVDAARTNTGWKTESGSNATKLAWVSFNATIPVENSVEQANAWYDRWEGFRKAHSPNLGGFQSAEVYMFMVTQNEMVKAAIMGICLSLFVSWLVLMLATMNWRVATLGLWNIIGITIVFLGCMPPLGWSLGENECIFLIAVVGLSVDYSVHLLHSYNNGSGSARTRENRVQHALGEMGISVTNSAITTLLAAVILFGCGFFFFFQFGAFIFFVIGFSILMSLTFLIPILLVLGPENEAGNMMCCKRGVSHRSKDIE